MHILYAYFILIFLGAPRISIRFSGPGYSLYAPAIAFTQSLMSCRAHAVSIRGAVLKPYRFISIGVPAVLPAVSVRDPRIGIRLSGQEQRICHRSRRACPCGEGGI